MNFIHFLIVLQLQASEINMLNKKKYFFCLSMSLGSINPNN